MLLLAQGASVILLTWALKGEGERPRKQVVEAAQVSGRNFGVVEPVSV